MGRPPRLQTVTPRALVPLLLLLTACGTSAPAPAAAPAPSPVGQQFEATAAVLESPEHGPELCWSMLDSLPPQCSGVPVVGWDWADVGGEESARGTTWGGGYHVVGTYDGTALTLTQPARDAPRSTTDQDPIGTPCPVPEGGWRVEDPTRLDDGAVQAAMAFATAHPQHAGFWLDHLDLSDPAALRVLNVATAGDVAAHERRLRELWGGALCVVRRPHTLARLREVQDEVQAGGLGLQVTSSYADEVHGVVRITAVTVDDRQRAALEERYGPGVVEVEPHLRPVGS